MARKPQSADDETPAALTPVEVAFVDWLARSPYRRASYHMHGIGNSTGSWTFMLSQVDMGPCTALGNDDATEARRHLFGRDHAPMGRLLRLGFVARAGEKEMAARTNEAVSFRATLYRIGRPGLDWWRAGGGARYEALAAKAMAERAEAERTVILGSWVDMRPSLPDGFSAPATRVMFATHAATVTRETEGRLYVEGLRQIYEPPGHHRVPVSGRPPNAYVEKAHVMFDHADDALAHRVAEHEATHWEELNAIQDAYARDVAEAMRRLLDRTRQKSAERADTLADLTRPKPPGRGPA